MLAFSTTSETLAQQKPPETKPAAPATGKPAPAATPAPAQQQSLPVSIEQALYLIRSTLLTLNDANHSGNYTVLRDLAAPDFQAHNTAADLGQSFSDLRRRNFDLHGAALLAPQLTAVPALDQKGMLRLTGYIPTRPLQINFTSSFKWLAISGGSTEFLSPRRKPRPRNHRHKCRLVPHRARRQRKNSDFRMRGLGPQWVIYSLSR